MKLNDGKLPVGLEVAGVSVPKGALVVGNGVVGYLVGESGESVGKGVVKVGELEGDIEGALLKGDIEGTSVFVVGERLGAFDGLLVGVATIGLNDGEVEGVKLGENVTLGLSVGFSVKLSKS